MSEVFSGDAIQVNGPISIITTTGITPITSNALSPPYQNAKCVVQGSVAFLVGASTTAVSLNVTRNPAAENALVVNIASLNVTAGNTVTVNFQGVDVIPDGRSVRYSVNLVQVGATGNGTINVATLSVFLLSG